MSADLINCLPPEAVYRRVELPEEENAWGPWSQAIARLGGLDERYLDRMLGAPIEPGPGNAMDPPDPTAQEIADFLTEQREILELVDLGLARGRLQIPAWTSDESGYYFMLFGSLVQLFRISRLAACKLFESGDPARAVAKSVALLRFGSMVCNGEGIVLLHDIGKSFRSMALDQLHRLALDDRVGGPLLREMRSAVEQSRGWPDGLQQCLRVDLCLWALPLVNKLPDCHDVEVFVDQLLATHYQNQLTLPEEESQRVVTDERLIRRREQILFLLRGHPAPFDRCDMARLMGQEMLEILRAGRFGWKQCCDRRIRRCRKWWPGQLTPWFPVDWLGDEAAPLLDQFRNWLPPTDEQLAMARERLFRIHNPVGILLAESYQLNLEPKSIRTRRQADLEGVRTVLALRVFETLHGKLPRELAELLEAGILRNTPLDPFCGKPLHYDPARAILWSVGEDGRDDGGNADAGYGRGRDIVWRLTAETER